MNSVTGQKPTHRHRKQTHGHQRGKAAGRDALGLWGSHLHTNVCAQSSPTVCNPVSCSPPGSSVPGTLRARTLEWVVLSSSRGSSMDCSPPGSSVPGTLQARTLEWVVLSSSRDLPWTAARQAPLFLGLSGLEHWSGLSFPPPGDLPDQGSNPASCTAGRLYR